MTKCPFHLFTERPQHGLLFSLAVKLRSTVCVSCLILVIYGLHFSLALLLTNLSGFNSMDGQTCIFIFCSFPL